MPRDASTAPDHGPRSAWMGVLAAAPTERLTELARGLELPECQTLRAPEIGLVLVRGRQGGDGAAFNLGEMTVTRCAVRLGSGIVGQAFVAGRRPEHARLAALLDAMLQREPDGPAAGVVATLREDAAAERETRLRKAAATRVEFFGLVRMG